VEGTRAPSVVLPFVVLARNLSAANFQGLGQLEADSGLDRENDIFVSGQGSAARPSPASRRQTNCGTFSPSGETANETAESCPSAGQNGGPLSFPFLRKGAC
jgi:hypothetical protein